MKRSTILLAAFLISSCTNDSEPGSQPQGNRRPGLGSTFRLETENNVPPSLFTVTSLNATMAGRTGVYQFTSDHGFVNWNVVYEANGDVSLSQFAFGDETSWYTFPIASRTEKLYRDSSSKGTNSYLIYTTRITASDGDSVTIQGKRYSTIAVSMQGIGDSYSEGVISASDTSNDAFHWSPEIGFYTRRVWKSGTITDSLVEFVKK